MIWPWTKFDTPSALPSRYFPNSPNEYTWEDWEKDTKKKYPVRFFLQNTFPRKWRIHIGLPIEDFFYWLRTSTINRYHILNLKCPTWGLEYEWGWIDRSEAILIAPFQLLKDFVEKEYPGMVDWESDEDHKEVAKEVKELYDWWMRGRGQSWDTYYEKQRKQEKFDANGEVLKEYRALLDESQKLEEQDDIMLLRLMKIRKFLWT